MTRVELLEGQNEIYNDAGRQVIGSRAPNENGLSPRELLEAALGLCVAISIQKVFERDGVTYEQSELKVEVSSAKEGDITNRFTNFYVKVQFPATLDAAYRKKVLTIAERGCTIGNTLKTSVVIETEEVE